jgi:hypothetical protein
LARRSLLKFLVLLLSLSLVSSSAFASNATKVGVGIGLIGAGTALAIDGTRRAICFGCSDNSGVPEAVVGFGMMGFGTFLLIKGLRENPSHFVPTRTRADILIGAAPIKHGWSGGLQIRW